MVDKLPLALFVFAVLAIGALIGSSFTPGPWYDGLTKPWFNPPGQVFAPVWTFLYILIAIAGWRAWYRNRVAALQILWITQMVLNFAWSPAFFGAKSPGLALAIILPMLAVIVLFIVRAWKRDRISSWLFMPYLAWVSFATLLNAAIFWLN